MTPEEPRGPFCQSCSMPLRQPTDFGTDAAGYRINDYCHHCYQDGRFTEPDLSMEQMIDRGSAIMAQRGLMPLDRAMALMSDVLPRMKRWHQDGTGEPRPAASGRGMTGGDREC